LYQIEKGTRDGRLSITAKLEEGWHVYSVTQPAGGPTRSVLKVTTTDDFEVTGPFQPDVPPHIKPPDVFPVNSEEHELEVTWTAPIRIGEGVDPAGLKPEVKYSGQVCKVSCIEIKGRSIEVGFDGFYETVSLSNNYRADRSHVELVGELGPKVVPPGGVVTLSVTATPDEGWHIYAYAEEDPKLISKPTLISISQPVGWSKMQVVASAEPIEHETGLSEEPIAYFHEEPVTWTVQIQVPQDAEPGEYTLQGGIGYQTCTLANCDNPTSASFSAKLNVTTTLTNETSAVGFSDSSYDEIAKQVAKPAEPESTPGDTAAPAFVLDDVKASDGPVGGKRPAISMLVMAFAAGFILNFMPCVLPVIGLKLASFVHQAGQDRRKIIRLNLWYTLGVMSVFMILATMATVFGLKWGQQFNSPMFNAILAAIVFAFALSFLGVWEIPLPGFASGGKMNELADQEGPGGAFFKGILTTVLATPCSGPLLVPAVAWALAQPPVITYSSFACVGLGLASPYLVIGAFPRLAAFLPKPGPWMETFKHIMGFVMLGTVVFLLTFLPMSYVVPVVTFLIGLWAMLWWVGRIPLYEPLTKRIRAWAEGAIFAAVIYAFAFGWLQGVMQGRFNEAVAVELSRQGDGSVKIAVRHENELNWQPYSAELLERTVNDRKTVFVDFTAPS
jgi:thiol:disulfide interchange protein